MKKFIFDIVFQMCKCRLCLFVINSDCGILYYNIIIVNKLNLLFSDHGEMDGSDVCLKSTVVSLWRVRRNPAEGGECE